MKSLLACHANVGILNNFFPEQGIFIDPKMEQRWRDIIKDFQESGQLLRFIFLSVESKKEQAKRSQLKSRF